LCDPEERGSWAEINRQQAVERCEFSRSLTPAERLALGERLAQEALALYAAAVRDGHLKQHPQR